MSPTTLCLPDEEQRRLGIMEFDLISDFPFILDALAELRRRFFAEFMP